MKTDLSPLNKQVTDTQNRIASLEQNRNYIEAYREIQKLEQYFAGFLVSAKERMMKSHIAIGAFRDKEAGVEQDVHTEHCCIIHGCKYGYDRGYDERECTVTTEKATQSYPCEVCCNPW